jgi:ubiquinone/menaquinone biosynthesis C-methylase UbiE
MFTHRSTQKEFLDAENILTEDLHQNLRELNTINKWLGGHAVTIAGLEQFHLQKDQNYTIVDIGCGGGDTLKAMADWGRKQGLTLRLMGVDLKSDCITYARNFCKDYPEISFIADDYKNLPGLNINPDIVVASLFCHHLHDKELALFLKTMSRLAKKGMVVNDLHRHPLAYYSIALLTKVFSKSYLVKNDAKLSVLRAFRKRELSQMASQLTGNRFSITWVWAFRWLLVIVKS